MGFISNCLVASLAGSTCLGGGGYLARIGPGPLRFEEAAVRLNPAMVLPPLNMGHEGTVTNTNLLSVNDSLTNLVDEPLGTEAVSNTPEIHVELPAPISDPGVSGSANGPEVTPQILLRYFNTNSNTETFISPKVIFTPPSPGPSRGSSATYISK